MSAKPPASLFDLHYKWSNAYFSPCRTWRYLLHRVWSLDHQLLLVVGLNPSTADEAKSDPTVTRCINQARKWGYGGLIMMNAFAVVGTDPQVLKKVNDPVGPENDYWLRVVSEDHRVGRILLAWGNHGLLFDRQRRVLSLLEYTRMELQCYGYTKTGAPRHPLYLSQSEPLRTWGR